MVWFPRFRPWVLSAGVLMHLMIDIHIQIGIFSYAMFVLYLGWVRPETARTLPDKLRQLTRLCVTVPDGDSEPQAASSDIGP